MNRTLDDSSTRSGLAEKGTVGIEHRILQQAKKMGRPMAASLVVQPGYLRKGDAAKYLGISIRTLSDWERKRVVPFFKMSHRMVLFKRSDLDDAMNRFRAAAIGE